MTEHSCFFLQLGNIPSALWRPSINSTPFPYISALHIPLLGRLLGENILSSTSFSTHLFFSGKKQNKTDIRKLALDCQWASLGVWKEHSLSLLVSPSKLVPFTLVDITSFTWIFLINWWHLQSWLLRKSVFTWGCTVNKDRWPWRDCQESQAIRRQDKDFHEGAVLNREKGRVRVTRVTRKECRSKHWLKGWLDGHKRRNGDQGGQESRLWNEVVAIVYGPYGITSIFIC